MNLEYAVGGPSNASESSSDVEIGEESPIDPSALQQRIVALANEASNAIAADWQRGYLSQAGWDSISRLQDSAHGFSATDIVLISEAAARIEYAVQLFRDRNSTVYRRIPLEPLELQLLQYHPTAGIQLAEAVAVNFAVAAAKVTPVDDGGSAFNAYGYRPGGGPTGWGAYGGLVRGVK